MGQLQSKRLIPRNVAQCRRPHRLHLVPHAPCGQLQPRRLYALGHGNCIVSFMLIPHLGVSWSPPVQNTDILPLRNSPPVFTSSAGRGPLRHTHSPVSDITAGSWPQEMAIGSVARDEPFALGHSDKHRSRSACVFNGGGGV
jgi:hypothetical protein